MNATSLTVGWPWLWGWWRRGGAGGFGGAGYWGGSRAGCGGGYQVGIWYFLLKWKITIFLLWLNIVVLFLWSWSEASNQIQQKKSKKSVF